MSARPTMQLRRLDRRRPGLGLLGLLGAAALLGVMSGCGSSGSSAPTTVAPAQTSVPDNKTSAAPATQGPQCDTSGEPAKPTATLPTDDIDAEVLKGWAPMDVCGAALAEFGGDTDNDPEVGKAVPVLTGYDVDGNVVRIDAANQGKTMIVVLAHWCPHCNNEVPVINDLRTNGALPSDLKVYGLISGSRPDYPNWPPQQWIKKSKWADPALLDGLRATAGGESGFEAVGMTALGGSSFPLVVLIDEQGKLAARWAGEANYNEFAARVDKYLYK